MTFYRRQIAQSLLEESYKMGTKAALQEKLDKLRKTKGKAGVMSVAAPDENVATAKTSLAVAQAKVSTLVTDLSTEVELLEIDTPMTYAYADELLARVRQGRGVWRQVWDRIQEKTIQPIRAGIEELYALNRDVDRPAEKLETAIKAKMRDYKLLEARQQREEDDRIAAEAQAKIAEAEAKQKAAEKAATPQVRGRLQAQATKLMEQAQEVLDTPTETQAVKGENSSDRKKPAWRIKDMDAFLKAVGNQTIEARAVLINTVWMNQQFKADPEGMEAWPGIEIYEDVQIVGSRR